MPCRAGKRPLTTSHYCGERASHSSTYDHERLQRPTVRSSSRTPDSGKQIGYANVQSKERFPHSHSLHGGYGVFQSQTKNRRLHKIFDTTARTPLWILWGSSLSRRLPRLIL